MTIRLCTLIALCGLTLSGCSQTTSGLPSVSKGLKLVREQPPVVRVLCLWEPSEGTGLNGAPARGFAGQILFFNSVNASPVAVEGKVEIYEFDDMGTIEEQSKPIHKFVFESGAWNAHQGDSSLGPSYNVFLPYVKKHGYETTCALRLRFTPEKGPAIYSEMNKITLPGAENPNGLHASKSTFSGSVQELLQERLGDLGFENHPENEGDAEESDDSQDRLVGGTRIRQTDKSENGLRTLTIQPRSKMPRARSRSNRGVDLDEDQIRSILDRAAED